MDQAKLIASGINYNMGLRRFAGKALIYEKYLKQFAEDPNFPKLEEEMQREAYKDAFKTAHALKGVIGTLSIDRLFVIISELVEALREENIVKAKEIMIEADAEYREVVGVLKECSAK
ncbi:MAG: hypothetical protein J6A75_00810 [Lachnospiraceae bacterium]|nr:hypothetical protein [Lachnospiraceae bacterium]